MAWCGDDHLCAAMVIFCVAMAVRKCGINLVFIFLCSTWPFTSPANVKRVCSRPARHSAPISWIFGGDQGWWQALASCRTWSTSSRDQLWGPCFKEDQVWEEETKTSKRVVQPEEEEQPDPKEHLRGVGQFQAEPYNLADMGQVLSLVEFLTLNGGWELFLTLRMEAACLEHSGWVWNSVMNTGVDTSGTRLSCLW